MSYPGWPAFVEQYDLEYPVPYATARPAWAEAFAMERQGRFAVWTCRVGDDLAGLIAVQFCPHLLFRGPRFCMVVGHNLAPQWRADPWRGYRMWKTMLEAVKERADVVLAFTHPQVRAAGFFRRLGFASDGAAWGKAL